jgi:hypothetical protein
VSAAAGEADSAMLKAVTTMMPRMSLPFQDWWRTRQRQNQRGALVVAAVDWAAASR